MTRRARLIGALVVAMMVAAGAAVAFIINQARVDPAAIASSVGRDPQAIARAWRLPVASTFQRRVDWQSNPSRCGPASVANALRSLNEGAVSEEAVLRNTGRCWTGLCIMGLTLDELADITRTKTGRTVTVLRNLSLEDFKDHLRRSNDPGRRTIVNFHRKAIFGAGAGHFSPIGGYLEDEDLVFVLDVNRDYQPWLVESRRLHAAIDTLDGDHKRGLLLIE